MVENILTKKEAIKFLSINEKEFNNYFQSGQEFSGFKESGRWKFDKSELEKWKSLRNSRIVNLSLAEYEKCFEFALKMAYSGKASHGTGIRGVRSEVQMADDFILGILAEHGVKKFLKGTFDIDIKLDMDVHPDHITPQDFDGIKENGEYRDVKIGVAVKSSKWKNCWNIIAPIEYENDTRKSDVYIFVRVGLPSDHLFRILREHSFFKNVKDFLEKSEGFRKIKELKEIPIWITGFSYHNELERVTEIPGQKFSGNPDHRYVKCVGKMHNLDDDWKTLIEKF
ncbi:MAG: helix-turn-helix domain-containing protein [Nanoarchaeota archaeon]|nr:helix-turn-helix domain-containing protein [Nanoarchaeota archaeon]